MPRGSARRHAKALSCARNATVLERRERGKSTVRRLHVAPRSGATNGRPLSWREDCAVRTTTAPAGRRAANIRQSGVWRQFDGEQPNFRMA